MEFRTSSLSQAVLNEFGIKSPTTLGSQFLVLNRVPVTEALAEQGTGLITLGYNSPSTAGDDTPFVTLDLETTGFDAATCEIIEVGILRGKYSPSEGRITALDEVLCTLQEPSKPLKPIITEVTGLTDEALKGQVIDEQAVMRIMDGVDLVIAHNAQFDRKFFDARFPQLQRKVWACSSKGGDIDWKSAGFRSAALESLLIDYGYFFDAHRASIDCMATAWLLMLAQDKFAELLHATNVVSYKVKAVGAPFNVKQDLKAIGFKWDGDNKVWHTTVQGDSNLEATMAEMAKLYPFATSLAQITPSSKLLRHAS
jgi:DNA polymerase-3 subunit epsilon